MGDCQNDDLRLGFDLSFPKNLSEGEWIADEQGSSEDHLLRRSTATGRTRRENAVPGPWRIEVARNGTTEAQSNVKQHAACTDGADRRLAGSQQPGPQKAVQRAAV